ncbi:aspartic peptidase domain-containing protein [Ochromonadaceae sp. CCMP2298]|nr:aspartic peptidase domain-containing protein [Ochromonadaceae sp. CCMP2298]|mmetsp:Transcript_19045/g.42466  ORF Transcript_19045/g.42466 Transcript_19045/m.42466 type:complete len:797 (+) Transcript_19045:67-2457(+)
MMQLWGILAVLAVLCPASGATLKLRGVDRTYTIAPHHDAGLPLPQSTHELGQMEMRPERRAGRRLGEGPELTPLFPGYGTHFAYAYVGTPPQRQSLIVDTGSHFTAFPCEGCKKCGKHTDNYFSVKNSTTAVIPSCDNKTCSMTQGYTEGSSWKAYTVQDKLWVGGLSLARMPMANALSMDFTFGCQTESTGLFVSQLADGIMGMSSAPDTLPQQLLKAKITPTTVFALCFRVGGGIMTLGGVDQKIHSKNKIDYAVMPANSNGWFAVILQSVSVKSETGSGYTPIATNSSVFNTGSGAIIDSGTTDIYLPKSVAPAFKDAFKSSGITYTDKTFKATPEQLRGLPSIMFSLKRVGDDNLKTVDITLTWGSYLDKVGDDEFTMRILFTEKTGTVLGSNFMSGRNVIFDADGGRVGFAVSTCNYEDFDPNEINIIKPAKLPGDCVPTQVPLNECTAYCDKQDAAYVAVGEQKWGNKCDSSAAPPSTVRPCSQNCSVNTAVRGNPECPDKPWTDCTHACLKSRQVVPSTDPLMVKGKCNYHLQTSTCYAGMCPILDGDMLIYIDLRVQLEPWRWSYIYSEYFFSAMTALFALKINSVELLNDAGNEYTVGTKLHFKIRLKAKDYADVTSMSAQSDEIVMAVRSGGFGERLMRALDETAVKTDVGMSRFGWMEGDDIKVLSAVALPMGGIRDKETILEESTAPSAEDINLVLLGVALAAILVLVVLGVLHMRLRHAHWLYEKDKGGLTRGGRALHKIMNQVTSAVTGKEEEKVGASHLRQANQEIEMGTRKGLMDEDLED